MAFSEEFYIDVRGEQKGPYTFPQLKRLYDTNLIPEEALYWQDGMDHWQPVADLCGAQRRERQRRLLRLRYGGGAAVAVVALLTAYCAPMVKEGWQEMNARDYSGEAAYWKARGFVREKLKTQGASVAFDALPAAGVTLTGGTGATVLLPGTLFPSGGPPSRTTWRVIMDYNPGRHEWSIPSPG